MKGICSRPFCHFSHVSQSSRFAVCENFLQKKFCPRGANCPLRHITNHSAKNQAKKFIKKVPSNACKDSLPVQKNISVQNSIAGKEKLATDSTKASTSPEVSAYSENRYKPARDNPEQLNVKSPQILGESFLLLDSSTMQLNTSGDDILESFITPSQSILPSFLNK